MSTETLEKLEDYRRKKRLSMMDLSRQLGIYHNYIYRWKKSGRIIGIYQRVVEEFLARERDHGRI